MSTFAILYLLDEALFNDTTSAGIVSYSLEHAQYIFKHIIGHALDTLKPVAKNLAGVKQRSAREITFGNGSFLRVDTTLRGGAYQLILVSEFGKTCARNPLKAEEVVTGTLNAVSKKGTVIIESTGEGNSGFFAEMVSNANQRGNDNLSPEEYKLFFFPWYEEPSYRMKKQINYDIKLTDYFDKLEKDNNIKIDQEQRNWYAHHLSIQGDKMVQEFPSSISEAFLASSDAFYFQQLIQEAYEDKRCLESNLYDPLEPVSVAMDIGINDLTVIIFFQVIHGEIRVIDYYEDNNKGVDFYARFLQQKPYVYRTIFLPHDAGRRDGIMVENTYEREFRRIFASPNTRFIVLKKTDKNLNISNSKMKMKRCVFSLSTVKPLLDQLSKYRKKWSEQLGKYLDIPLHDISSHYADAFIYMCQGVQHTEAVSNQSDAWEKHKQAVQSRKRKI